MPLPLLTVLIFGYYLRITASFTVSECGVNRWRCANGRCIYLINRCDSAPDCLTEAEELGCPYLVVCDLDHRSCDNGQCVNKRYFCDGIVDCSDYSDEKCHYTQRTTTPTPRTRRTTWLPPIITHFFTRTHRPVTTPKPTTETPPTTTSRAYTTGTLFTFPTIWPTWTPTTQRPVITTDTTPCRPVPDSNRMCRSQFRGYLRYPTDCTQFIVCEWGYRFDCKCPPKTRWDQRALTCVWEYMVPCIIEGVTTTTPIPVTSDTTTTPMTTTSMATTIATPTTTARPTTTTVTTTTPTTTTTQTTTLSTTKAPTTTVATTTTTQFIPVEPDPK